MSSSSFQELGFVIIGRNEGERLRQSFLSVLALSNQIVYVDSGSTDGSRELANFFSIAVIELDLSLSFTAARARNTGFEFLLTINPHLKYVQFIDGDCEIVTGWLESAVNKLNKSPDIAVVCGRRREIFPQNSLYNLLCDLEWDTPIGETKYCGGDAMIRVEAFRQVGGYKSDLIAGEEPELCVRLRQQGWKIFRIDAEMTLHNANINEFSQWWRRNLRAGYAYAEGSHLHGKPPECHWVKESRSIWFWGLILPFLAVILGFFTDGYGFFFLIAYPLLLIKIFINKKQQNMSFNNAFIYAYFCVLGKFPQLQGQIKYCFNQLFNKNNKLIEYKVII